MLYIQLHCRCCFCFGLLVVVWSWSLTACPVSLAGIQLFFAPVPSDRPYVVYPATCTALSTPTLFIANSLAMSSVLPTAAGAGGAATKPKKKSAKKKNSKKKGKNNKSK